MVPKTPTIEQKEACKKVCTDPLNAIGNDSNVLQSVITCDESSLIILKLSANPCTGRAQLY